MMPLIIQHQHLFIKFIIMLYDYYILISVGDYFFFFFLSSTLNISEVEVANQ